MRRWILTAVLVLGGAGACACATDCDPTACLVGVDVGGWHYGVIFPKDDHPYLDVGPLEPEPELEE